MTQAPTYRLMVATSFRDPHRLAVDSIPVVAACPPLRVAGVAIESVTVRAPLDSAGVTPRPRSYGGIRLPMRHRASSQCAGCTALALTGGAHRISRVSRLCPVDVPRSSTPVGSRGPWPLAPLIEPSMLLTMSAPTVLCSSRGSIPSRWRIAAHQLSVYAS